MHKDNLLENIGRRTGMTVPDGYFDSFATRMEASLPDMPWESAKVAPAPRRSLWTTLRPYIYMAAMFAGVWCMMYIFNQVRPGGSDLSVAGNSLLTAAVSNDDFMNHYFIDDIDRGEILDEMWTDGVDPADYSVATYLVDDSVTD